MFGSAAGRASAVGTLDAGCSRPIGKRLGDGHGNAFHVDRPDDHDHRATGTEVCLVKGGEIVARNALNRFLGSEQPPGVGVFLGVDRSAQQVGRDLPGIVGVLANRRENVAAQLLCFRHRKCRHHDALGDQLDHGREVGGA